MRGDEVTKHVPTQRHTEHGGRFTATDRYRAATTNVATHLPAALCHRRPKHRPHASTTKGAPFNPPPLAGGNPRFGAYRVARDGRGGKREA